jgi:hypothetical protein
MNEEKKGKTLKGEKRRKMYERKREKMNKEK